MSSISAAWSHTGRLRQPAAAGSYEAIRTPSRAQSEAKQLAVCHISSHIDTDITETHAQNRRRTTWQPREYNNRPNGERTLKRGAASCRNPSIGGGLAGLTSAVGRHRCSEPCVRLFLVRCDDLHSEELPCSGFGLVFDTSRSGAAETGTVLRGSDGSTNRFTNWCAGRSADDQSKYELGWEARKLMKMGRELRVRMAERLVLRVRVGDPTVEKQK